MMGRIVGIDYGLKRIGLALSDPTKMLASPLETVITDRSTDKTIDKLLAALEGQEIEEIVVGLPYRLSGKKGLQADEVEHFSKKLEGRTTARVVLWDERLTSVQAERSLREANLSRKKRAKLVDAVAAVIILQSYLDAREAHGGAI